MTPLVLLCILAVLCLFIADLLGNLYFAPWSKPHIVYKRRHYTARRRSLFGFVEYLGRNYWGSYFNSKDFKDFEDAKKHLNGWLEEESAKKAIRVERTRAVTGPIELETTKGEPYKLNVIRGSKGEALGFHGPDGEYYDLTSKDSI